jgi:hypothetical protein
MVITGILATTVTAKIHKPNYLEEGEQSTQIRKNIKEIYGILLRKPRLCYTVTGDIQIILNTIKYSIQYFFFLTYNKNI